MRTYRVIISETYFEDFRGADGFKTNAETGTISILVRSGVIIAIFCIKNIIGVKIINE
jgi:hypothetical protein